MVLLDHLWSCVLFFSCSYSLCFPGLHGDPCHPDCWAPSNEVGEFPLCMCQFKTTHLSCGNALESHC